MKVLVLFLVGLSISACSGGGSLDVSKSDETSITKFEDAGTFNEQPTLKVNFKSAISSVVPFGNTKGFFERPVLFSANKQGSIRFGAFDQDAQYLCDKTPNKIF